MRTRSTGLCSPRTVAVAAIVAATGCGSGTKQGGAGAHPDVDASTRDGATSNGGTTGSGDGGASSGGSSGGASNGGSAGASAGGASGAGGTDTGGGPGAGGVGGSGSGGTGVIQDAGADGNVEAGAGSSGPVNLTVDVSGDVHRISPLIYGVNPNGVACDDSKARFTVCRLGSNSWSTYNWENNASNEGGDGLCFENNDVLGTSNTPGNPVTSLIDSAGNNAALVTIPLLDYVAADKIGGSGPPLCTGDVRDSGSNYLDTRFKKNRSHKGAPLSASPDTTDDYVNQDEFVSFVKSYAPPATKILFSMDNQPELWGQTHIDVHPNHSTYVEVAAKNVEYATMVKELWPEAEVTGAVGYGYDAFLNLQFAPDSAGKVDWYSYYLAAMQAADTAAGKRLVDYLDLHWYSEVVSRTGISVLKPDTTPPDADVVSARVQAPRSLWDATYWENSWIANDQIHAPIDLIHWLQARIATYYPGTKIAFSSWGYGGCEDISGAVAAADVLGIFGRENVGLAGAEPPPGDTSFLIGAFAAYRNFDGAGATFGDTSVAATTSDVSRVSIYASVDSADSTHAVLVVINRATAPVATHLALQHTITYATADVYQITSTSALPVAATALSANIDGTFDFEPPAMSVSVIVPKLETRDL